MNKARRKELSRIIKLLGMIKDDNDLYSIINELDDIKLDEENYHDNIPENLQYSQRAEDSEQAIDNLENALELLNDVYNAEEFDKNSELIQEAIDKIEDAAW